MATHYASRITHHESRITESASPLALQALTGLETAVGNTPLLPLRRVSAGLSLNVQVLAKV